MVRLYYYRDAHRVAQIVNRDVQSYNYVAVDTRRLQMLRKGSRVTIRTPGGGGYGVP